MKLFGYMDRDKDGLITLSDFEIICNECESGFEPNRLEQAEQTMLHSARASFINSSIMDYQN
jgi:Ca2+-binding EF-hand superfamily protein